MWHCCARSFLSISNLCAQKGFWDLDNRYGSIDDSHKLRASIGINFNWDSAIGPINFIFSEPFMAESTDTTDKFSFDIGYNF
jgi:outer membrane protein assembly factor BamA